MNLGTIIDSLRAEDLVGNFKSGLKDAGVKIAEDSVAKYFAVETAEITLLLLTHESNPNKGWWGRHHDIVDRIRNSEPGRTNHIGWGAVLLHKAFQRGYWIRGNDIFRMKTLCLVTLGLLLASPAFAEMGFDEKYERDYNIFNPANQYRPDNPLNPADRFDPNNPFNPANGFDPGNPVNPANQYNPSNPFNPANKYNPDNPLNPANRYNPETPFKPLR